MKTRHITRFLSPILLALSSLPARALAANVLTTSSFSSCQDNSTIQVTALDVSFDRDTATVTFNAAGTNDAVQNVTATLTVSVYGKQVYTNSFNPCDGSTYVEMLCPGGLDASLSTVFQD